MKNLTILLAPIAMMMAAPAAAQQVEDVQFARGTTGTTINGSITGRQYIDYRLRLAANQRFSVTLTPRRGTPYFNVYEPNSNGAAIFVGSSSGNQFDATSGRAGVYTIRVYQMRASGRRGETARYTLAMSAGSSGGNAAVRPPVSPPFHSRDALVSGTPYHATAMIRCVSQPRRPMTSCRAGVTRRAVSATIHVDTPDGGERNIIFRDGRVASTDAQSRFDVQRRGDTTIIRIGRDEVYEIPDAFVNGG